MGSRERERRLPTDLRGKTDPSKRVLLDRIPKLLAGYGNSLRGQNAAVVVVVDLDTRDGVEFLQELASTLDSCHPKPCAVFRLAIEEVEAWMLGDRSAVLRAFPRAKTKVLDAYKPDSICGTWEGLADGVFPGGANRLRQEGYRRIGEEKCKWAAQIGPHIDIEGNRSPSFHKFKNGLRKLAGSGT